VSGHTPWRQLDTDKNELGFRAAKEMYAEAVVSTSQDAEMRMGLLIAKRLRSFNIREGVKNNDARDLHVLPVPERQVGSSGPSSFNRFAGNSSL
jgi:hypothetical protein